MAPSGGDMRDLALVVGVAIYTPGKAGKNGPGGSDPVGAQRASGVLEAVLKC